MDHGASGARRLRDGLLTGQARSDEAKRLPWFGLNPDGSIACEACRTLGRISARTCDLWRRGFRGGNGGNDVIMAACAPQIGSACSAVEQWRRAWASEKPWPKRVAGLV